jgi:glycerophosphoryl diester phosphodiesterase
LKKLKRTLLVIAVITVALWVNNTSLFTPISSDPLKIIAHRGVHQIYAGNDKSNHTCRAQEVEPFTHEFIENTLPSMQAAFAYGADVVELDIHVTPDQQVAVFHDWRLECQTEGVGVTEEQPLSYLKSLDLGYDFSADGKSYPLRGKGVGLLPTLQEVFDEKLAGKLLVNFKSNRKDDGIHLAKVLENPAYKSQVFGVYGGQRPTRETLKALPELRGYDKASIKACLKDYALLGWSGVVSESCSNQIIVAPINIAPFLWGWPHKFTARMKAANTEVILLGPYDDSGFSSGIDDSGTFEKVPDGFSGYIWTNKIELIGPLSKQ